MLPEADDDKGPDEATGEGSYIVVLRERLQEEKMYCQQIIRINMTIKRRGGIFSFDFFY